MDRTQLGTRIPRDLDAEIEKIAKRLRLKKQDLVVQLLRYGLVAVRGSQFSTQETQFDEPRFNSENPELAEHFLLNGRNNPTASSPSVNDSFEKRLAHLELNLLSFSHQLAELTRLTRELHSVISRSPTDFSNVDTQASLSSISTAIFNQEHAEQQVTTQLSKSNDHVFSLEAKLPSSELQAGNGHLKEQAKQSQESHSTLPVDAEGVDLDASDEEDARAPQTPSISLTAFSESKKQVNQAVEESSWLTLKEAYELIEKLGYRELYQDFRVRMMLTTTIPERNRLEWGFEFHPDCRRLPLAEARWIRFHPGGKIAQALQALSEGHQITNLFSDKSSTFF